MIPVSSFSSRLRPRKPAGIFLAVLELLTSQTGSTARAWGSHPKIRAARSRLGPDHPLVRFLGREADELSSYCWMDDWHHSLVVRSPSEAFLADDFLLFSVSPELRDHGCPEVEATFEPFFCRAVQAAVYAVRSARPVPTVLLHASGGAATVRTLNAWHMRAIYKLDPSARPASAAAHRPDHAPEGK
jgi:hypothetical protein